MLRNAFIFQSSLSNETISIMPQPDIYTPIPLPMLPSPEARQYIAAHRSDDVRKLALSMPRGASFSAAFVLEQIAGWQAARRKLPTWAGAEGVVYPPHLSMEQCSSEQTARYKAQLAARLMQGRGNDTSMADLTGGFGVDFSFLAPVFARAAYNERNAQLCATARHNFGVLGITNATVTCCEAGQLLEAMEPVDMIFMDPARRDLNGAKTVAIAHCSPDVSALRPLLLSKASVLMIKLSPMLDWHKAIADMGGSVHEVHIVAVGGECKELLLVADTAQHGSVDVTCVNDSERFGFSYTPGQPVPQPALMEPSLLLEAGAATPLYLFEPNASIMKAGCFGLLARQFGLKAVGRSSNLFAGTAPCEGFPGRRFTISGCSTMNRRSLKQLLAATPRANVAVRNLPLSADALRKKLGIKDGGTSYIFGTTAADGTHLIILCKRI